MTGPITPPSGSGFQPMNGDDEIPDSNPFNVPGYSEFSTLSVSDDQSLEVFLQGISARFPVPPNPRLTLVDFLAAIADGILDMIRTAKDVDKGEYRSRLVAQEQTARVLIPDQPTTLDLEVLGQAHDEIYGEIDDLELNDRREDVEDAENAYNAAIPAYNAARLVYLSALATRDQAQIDVNVAQAAYDADPTPANLATLNAAIAALGTAQTALNTAETNFNNAANNLNAAGVTLQEAIDYYNSGINQYNAYIAQILADKAAAGSPAIIQFKIQGILNTLNRLWQDGPRVTTVVVGGIPGLGVTQRDLERWGDDIDDLIDAFNDQRAAYNAAFDPDVPGISSSKLDDLISHLTTNPGDIEELRDETDAPYIDGIEFYPIRSLLPLTDFPPLDYSTTNPAEAFPYGSDIDNPSEPSPLDGLTPPPPGDLQGMIDITFPPLPQYELVILKGMTLEEIEALRDAFNKTAVEFMSRGAPKEKVKDSEQNEAVVSHSAAQGVTLSSIALGLNSSDLSALISSGNLAQAVSEFFETIGFDSANAAGVFVNTTVGEAIAAATLAIVIATKIAANFLKEGDPNSSITGLAGNVAILQALEGAISNGELVHSALLQLALLGDGQEGLAETIADLGGAALLSTGVAGIPGSSNPNASVLGTLAFNLSFGIGGNQLSLRETVKSIKDTTGTDPLSGFQKDLTDAFTDVIASGGISGDASAALAIRYAEGLFVADDPDAFLREAAGSDNLDESIAVQLAGVVNFSQFSDTLGDDFLKVDPNSDLAQKLGDPFVAIANSDLSNTRKIAALVAHYGVDGASAHLGLLRHETVTGSMEERLLGQIGQSDAKLFAEEAFTSVNSSTNLLADLIRDLNQRSGGDGQYQALETILKPWKIGEKPSEFLSKLAKIPAGAALWSIYLEGLKTPSGNMKVGIPEDEGGKGFMNIAA